MKKLVAFEKDIAVLERTKQFVQERLLFIDNESHNICLVAFNNQMATFEQTRKPLLEKLEAIDNESHKMCVELQSRGVY